MGNYIKQPDPIGLNEMGNMREQENIANILRYSGVQTSHMNTALTETIRSVQLSIERDYTTNHHSLFWNNKLICTLSNNNAADRLFNILTRNIEELITRVVRE